MSAHRVWYVPFGVRLVPTVADALLPEREDADYSAVDIVFPGRRAGLYLRRHLAARHPEGFRPPRIWQMDEFLLEVVRRSERPEARRWGRLEELWHLDRLWMRHAPDTAERMGRSVLERWPWLERLADFLSTTEAELVGEKVLKDVGLHAEVGIETLPEELNRLFERLAEVREEFRRVQDESGGFTRGRMYAKAAEACGRGVEGFGRVLFVGLFGLTRAERKVIGGLLSAGVAEVVWHGDPSRWEAMRRADAEWGVEAEPLAEDPGRGPLERDLTVHASASTLYEAEDLRYWLERDGEKSGGEAVVVLPASESLLPVLTFGLPRAEDLRFNISLDYPVDRSPVFSLVGRIKAAVAGARTENNRRLWRLKDLLALLEHPFVKNMVWDDVVVRDAVERLREALSRKGMVYADLDGLLAALRDEADGPFRKVLEGLWRVFVEVPSSAATLAEACDALEAALRAVLERTAVRGYVLSAEVFRRFFEGLGEVRSSRLASETVDAGRMWEWLEDRLGGLEVRFDTRPLQPLEILGMLETRGLDFERVYVLDVEEGILPRTRDVDPLVPMDLAGPLGVPTPEEREEVYRYHLMRLVMSAGTVRLFHRETAEVRRSRYVEALVWEAEKRAGRLGALRPCRRPRSVGLFQEAEEARIPKTPEVMERLTAPDLVLSVTALDDLLACGIRFYYKTVLGLKPPPEDVEEGLDVAERGEMLHKVLEKTYRPFVGQVLEPDRVWDAFNAAFGEVFDKGPPVSGEHLLFRRIAWKKLQDVLEEELKRRHEFRVEALELPVTGDVGGFRFKGRIDRLDRLQGSGGLRVIDYKSGRVKGKFAYRPEVAALARPTLEDVRSAVGSLQLVLYKRLLEGQRRGDVEDARLVSLLVPSETLGLTDAPKRGEGKDASAEETMGFYLRMLDAVLEKMRDFSDDFRKYADTECEHCDYRRVCRFADPV